MTPATPYNIFRIANVLLGYDRVYMVEAGSGGRIDAPELSAADRLVVYAADGAGGGEEIAALFGADRIEKLWNRDMITAYMVTRGAVR